jgi:hypothetical protein
MSYDFKHIKTNILDPEIYGSNKEVFFECEGFTYYARFFENILQYVKNPKPNDYNDWITPPSEQQLQENLDRIHDFNADHSIVQNWFDMENL